MILEVKELSLQDCLISLISMLDTPVGRRIHTEDVNSLVRRLNIAIHQEGAVLIIPKKN